MYKTTGKTTIVGLVIDNKLHVGVSVCSNDTEFDAHLGKSIAEGRAKTRPFAIISLLNNNARHVASKFDTASETVLSFLSRKTQNEWGQKTLQKVN